LAQVEQAQQFVPLLVLQEVIAFYQQLLPTAVVVVLEITQLQH
jgi:hypothetical protein